ncbi:hypothetical protein X801_07470 [Opisthorchis viverrini]|uniref:Uncharacterized protein n=1 Tax=Opisthorchis viverrini TaxID=6198 RepID=A0A1S8WQN5_OPIVI|nr:hypothetical protein X801_07470 [Opisthorchis viverrini]
MARFRVLRLFKVGTFWETFDRLDQRLNAGYAVRLARTITYMIFIIHLEACGYYAFNRIQGMNASTWSIPMGKISPRKAEYTDYKQIDTVEGRDHGKCMDSALHTQHRLKEFDQNDLNNGQNLRL